MQVNITFRQMSPIESLKEYAREKVDRVHKYLDRAGEAHVVLSLERHLHHADITIQSGAWVLRGREKSEDMYASIDLAMDKIERQLRRYKERLKHHHGRDKVHHRQELLRDVRVRYDVVAVPEPENAPAPEAASPRIIRTNEFIAKPMSVEDAVMQMDLMNNDFLVFTNSTSREVNVVYRRKDGHYGLIEAIPTREPAEQLKTG
ncbi:MAG: ribosome-associated translation inhibitor RaiA [Myxococcales bacterium]|nr:ribosome-associated translation inhibitor RaiA [Myxococcales bacterium]